MESKGKTTGQVAFISLKSFSITAKLSLGLGPGLILILARTDVEKRFETYVSCSFRTHFFWLDFCSNFPIFIKVQRFPAGALLF